MLGLLSDLTFLNRKPFFALHNKRTVKIVTWQRKRSVTSEYTVENNIMRKPRERLRDALNISAYDGWNVPQLTKPYTSPYFLLWILEEFLCPSLIPLFYDKCVKKIPRKLTWGSLESFLAFLLEGLSSNVVGSNETSHFVASRNCFTFAPLAPIKTPKN